MGTLREAVETFTFSMGRHNYRRPPGGREFHASVMPYGNGLRIVLQEWTDRMFFLFFFVFVSKHLILQMMWGNTVTVKWDRRLQCRTNRQKG